MATISTRIDENIKSEAEKIADEIGIPLSTAINIFIKKFISDRGFPFSVTVSDKNNRSPVIDESVLDKTAKNAVSDPSNNGLSNQFTYLDPITKKLTTIIRDE